MRREEALVRKDMLAQVQGGLSRCLFEGMAQAYNL